MPHGENQRSAAILHPTHRHMCSPGTYPIDLQSLNIHIERGKGGRLLAVMGLLLASLVETVF